jgi:hypothetical protein
MPGQSLASLDLLILALGQKEMPGSLIPCELVACVMWGVQCKQSTATPIQVPHPAPHLFGVQQHRLLIQEKRRSHMGRQVRGAVEMARF